MNPLQRLDFWLGIISHNIFVLPWPTANKMYTLSFLIYKKTAKNLRDCYCVVSRWEGRDLAARDSPLITYETQRAFVPISLDKKGKEEDATFYVAKDGICCSLFWLRNPALCKYIFCTRGEISQSKRFKICRHATHMHFFSYLGCTSTQ
jgi:hypothetical protein